MKNDELWFLKLEEAAKLLNKKDMRVEVSPELAKAIHYLYEVTNGFEYEMYCEMNKYVFNPPEEENVYLESLKAANLFVATDAIRYGYIIKD